MAAVELFIVWFSRAREPFAKERQTRSTQRERERRAVPCGDVDKARQSLRRRSRERAISRVTCTPTRTKCSRTISRGRLSAVPTLPATPKSRSNSFARNEIPAAKRFPDKSDESVDDDVARVIDLSRRCFVVLRNDHVAGKADTEDTVNERSARLKKAHLQFEL